MYMYTVIVEKAVRNEGVHEHVNIQYDKNEILYMYICTKVLNPCTVLTMNVVFFLS